MRFAFFNGQRVEPSKGLRGSCPCCGTEVVAKCGQFNIHHWAHKNLKSCDPWWENESEWHRQWKSYFPVERQEVVFRDITTQEKHIADVYSQINVVMEFQSYSISPEEMRAREIFYQKMIWIVNGQKNPLDKRYFSLSMIGRDPDDPMAFRIRWVGRGKLFAKWSQATKHVYIDFGTDIVWHLQKFDIQSKTGQIKAFEKKRLIKFFGGIV